ncbi:bestrophin-like domain [Phenylobacterium sp.]|uniref:bestrophin-like domain n=1 Tax=Phenylobacterium sp. TaxID=1871053 RepID=UPI002FE0A0BB
MGFLFIGLLLASAIGAVLATRLSFRGWGPPTFAQVSAVTLTPLSVVFGFTVAFLAAQVWGSWDRAVGFVGQEASALQESVVLAEALDPALGRALAADIAVYAAAAPAEWRAMEARTETLRAPPAGLLQAVHRVATYSRPDAAAATDRILAALDTALDARRHRILISETGALGLGRWLAAAVLAMCLQLTIAMVHAHDRRAQLLTVAVFTVAAVTALAMVAAFDQPFRATPAGVQPHALLELAAPPRALP